MCYTIQNNTLDYYAYFYPRKREIMTTQDYRTRRPLRIFLSYFRPHRGLFLLDITCAFFIAVIDLAFPLISRTAMYHWLPEKQFSIFFTVMALVVAAFVLRAGLYFIVGYWGHTFGILVEADIRRDLFAHMQDLGFDFYDKNRTGQLMSRLTTDLFELTELAHHGPEDLFISLVTIIGGSLPGLFSGALITETLFAIPGIGYISYQAMVNGDIPFSMFYLVFLSVLTLLGNLIADVLYAVVDPRVRIA